MSYAVATFTRGILIALLVIEPTYAEMRRKLAEDELKSRSDINSVDWLSQGIAIEEEQ